jgi:NAD(P)-dependent dehydrogenase (short-subunit alcohol dehydrogenase family)
MNLLAERVAVVTGGARGIGLAIARALLREGAVVVLADSRIETAEQTAKDLSAYGMVEARALDVRDWSQVREVFDSVQEDRGRIDIDVNAAGIQAAAPSLEMSEENWRAVLDTNLSGVFACAQAAGVHMARQRSGSIINIGSVAGVRGLPGRVPYGAAKAGVSAVTRVLGAEWAAHGVRVNAIAPGWVETDLFREAVEHGRLNEQAILDRIPLRRLGQPDEIAELAVFLASDQSSYFTGQTLYPDGGYLACGE